jgi:hypothetical protein
VAPTSLVSGTAAVPARALASPVLTRRLQGWHRKELSAVAGDQAGARDAYQAAAGRTTNLPQQRYLNARAARLLRGLPSG